jgi:hypothetical protein
VAEGVTLFWESFMTIATSLALHERMHNRRVQRHHPEYGPPSRKVLSRRRHRLRSKFISYKTRHIVHCECPLERDYAIQLEVDDQVVDFAAQPQRLDLMVDGECKSHFPDFLVIRRGDERQIVEVKEDEQAKLWENDPVAIAATEYCLNEGYEYRIVSESDIRKGPKLDNAKQILRNRMVDIPYETKLKILEFIETASRTIPDVSRHIQASHAKARKYLLNLVAWDCLRFDLKAPLTERTRFWMP